jgi:xanthine dehydrogenase YagR molybdenum-binding subunit
VSHYHQAVALVVAETFEQARAAANLVDVRYARSEGSFDLAGAAANAKRPEKLTGGAPDTAVGNFETAFAAAPVTLDERYTTPDEAHAMMEPHASTAAWNGDQLTLWTSNQMIDWAATDLATTLGIAKDQVRVVSPFIGGGFGGKLFIRADAVLAALGARAAGRPVKVALTRPMMFNNTPHRPATMQRVRIGANRDGLITAIAHESVVGRSAGRQGRQLGPPDAPPLCGAHRMTATRLAVLNLPEANAMRAPARRRAHGPGARDRRDGREARPRPDRVPHPQRHAGRPRAPGATVLAARPDPLPARRRDAIWLEPA